jgi:two-component system sensor histidine kinase KdpD
VVRIDRSLLVRIASVVTPSLLGATAVVAVLEELVGVPDASPVYLVAVVISAYLTGTVGAVVAAVGAFLLYNFLFTSPQFTFQIHDPGVLLNVFLLLFVGIVVGELAAVQRSREHVALAREREARALFQLSRAIVSSRVIEDVLREVTELLVRETRMHRIWIGLGRDEAVERVVTDSGHGGPPGTYTRTRVLRRTPGDAPAEWITVIQPTGRPRTPHDEDLYRVRIERSGLAAGSIRAARPRGLEPPDRTETRLIAAAADQLAQALDRERLATESQTAEVARRSDALKSALLQSVSHDLRTPLATIRAAAGALRPDAELSADDRQASINAIDREVAYLDRMVANMLDLSRVEAGVLRAANEPLEIEDLLDATLARLHSRLEGRPISVALEAQPASADPVLLDAVFANLLDNVIRHTRDGTAVEIRAETVGGDWIRVSVEDAGAGVPDEYLPRLFERFLRVPVSETGPANRTRAGTGIGLAVVKGLVEAMGGRVAARRSRLGGLAIDIDLRVAPLPAALVAQTGETARE